MSGVLITVLWGAVLFEAGLDFFVDRLGVTLFVLCGLSFALLFGVRVLTGGLRLRAAGLLDRHQVLIGSYLLYWLISWLGVLTTPWNAQSAALVAVAQYAWYTGLALLTIATLRTMPRPTRVRILRWAGALSGCVLLWFSASAVVTGEAVSATLRSDGSFSVGAFRDYNVFALSLLLSVMLAFCRNDFPAERPGRLMLLLYMALVAAAALLGTAAGSRRTLLIYLPIALVMPLLQLTVRWGARGWLRWAGAVTALGGAAVLAAVVVAERMPTLDVEAQVVEATVSRVDRALGFFTGEYSDIGSRTVRWQRAMGVADEYSPVELLVGRGTRSFLGAPEFMRPDGSADTPHNFLLTALLEGGIAKLLVLLVFVLAWCVHVAEQCREQGFWQTNFLIAATLLWITTSLISGDEFFWSRHFMLFAVVYGASWRPTGEPTTHGGRPWSPSHDAVVPVT
jgi:hypothetical protein